MKKFFKKTEGFTLVELIVVIAILGILAGVGTVGYSGYIKKAQTAADNQIVAAVNTAFGAACAENAVNPKDVTSAEVGLTADKAVSGLNSVVIPGDDVVTRAATMGPKATKVIAAFDKYFAGNANSKFKVFDKLNFNPATGTFEGVDLDDPNAAGATVTLPGGGTVTLTAAQVELLKASTYSKDVSGLMNQVNNVGGLVAGLLQDSDDAEGAAAALFGFMQSDEYLTSAIVAMGGTVDPDADLLEQYGAVVGAFKEEQAIKQLADQLGVNPEDIDINGEHTEAYNALIGGIEAEVDKNILVLGIAQSAATQSKDGAMAIINSTDPKGNLLNAMLGKDANTDSAGGMGNAALVYGAFTAYANSDSATQAAKDALANSSDPTAVFDILSGEELTKFQTYMGSTQGQKDMDALIAAMEVIDNTATDADAVSGVLANGFANADFVSALQNLLK